MASVPDREKALDLALAQIDKQFGKGSVMRLGERPVTAMAVIPTGSIALDVALGLGGLPRGRVVEIYGPESSGKTTVALHAIANAQAAGGIAAFIDAEHALDADYAKALGVDTDSLLVSQPDTGEQALEITDMLVRSGALDIIVIDSVAALVPRAEIEGEMGDNHVGLQARLMSQALRKITGALNASGTTAIFINQLREKIGVMFGCGSWNTKVMLSDGTREDLGKIVDQKLAVEVLSYDIELDKIVPKRVVNWFNNGTTDEFVEFKVERAAGGTGRGRATIAFTRNHQIRTPGGWREAGEIVVGDRVMLAQPHLLSPSQWQVILGSVMGDGNLSPAVRTDQDCARFRMGHGAKQVDYLAWKTSLLGNIPHSDTTNVKEAVFTDFTPLAELNELRRAVYLGDHRKHLSWEYLKALTPLSLAVWYMDDGSFTLRSKGLQQRAEGGSGKIEICVEAMSAGSRERLVNYLRDTHGLDVKLEVRGARRINVLRFSTDASAKFQALVAPYVHPSMEYKLLPRFRGKFAVEPEFVQPELRLVPAKVLEINVRRDCQTMDRYDIEVEGSHNYLADGVMVHNSPETTTGGKALKFYASVRLDVRRIESLKDGGDMVGNRTRVKVVKNKCLAKGTTIFDPMTGKTHRIEEIVDGHLPISVVAAAKNGELRVRQVTNWFDQGEQDVIGIRLRGGAELWATPDHQVLTDKGWRFAGELRKGDRIAQPRQFLGFGDVEPYSPDHARLLGYLIGDGYVGGKTPIHFINIQESLKADASRIAARLGCETHTHPGKIEIAFSHRRGERNGVLELCRSAGIYGKLAWEKTIPTEFFAPGVSAEVVGNLLFGLFESDGWVSYEQTGAIRVGYTTTSQQLAHQIQWLLLRYGIASSVRHYDPTGQRPSLIRGRRVQGKRLCYEVRVAGSDNVEAFAAAVPMWGPRGQALVEALRSQNGRRRGSQAVYLSAELTDPVLAHLRDRGVTPTLAASLIGAGAGDPRGGMKQVLGLSRLRRDRLQVLADVLDDSFLHELLADQLRYAAVRELLPLRRARTFDIEVDELHTFVADSMVVHNCAAPFKQAEFDILYGLGISREGSLIDVGVEQSIIRKAGAWYTYEGDQLGQGKENARRFLKENPDVAAEIEKKILEKLGVGAADADASGDAIAVDF
jgi:recombination protein RecA